MIFYKVENDEVEKYDVTFHKKVLMRIRDKAIKNCSLIRSRTYKGYRDAIKESSTCHITNRKFLETKQGLGEYEDYDIYLYEYEEYEVPPIVELINRLLSGDSSVLCDILNPKNIVDKKQEFLIKIDELSKKIDTIPNSEYQEKIDLLEELKSMVEDIPKNEKQTSEARYYYDLKGAISFELLSTISLEEAIKVLEFFDSIDKVKGISLSLNGKIDKN